MKMALVVALLAGVSTPAFAQTVAVTNAHIMTMGKAGDLTSATLLIVDGKIMEVGPTVHVPAGARVIDAKGRVVTPGLIMTGTVLGIDDLPTYGELDDSQTSNGKISASYDIQYSLNHATPELVDARADGVTAALVTPDVGEGTGSAPRIYGGEAGVIKTAASPNILFRNRVGIVARGGAAGAVGVGGGRGVEILLIKQQLAAARAAAMTGKKQISSSSADGGGLSKADLEALIPVVTRKSPLYISVDRAADILTLLALAKSEDIRLVLIGASEAWTVAKEIAAASVGVIVDPQHNIPEGLDDAASSFENAARLRAAGVTVSFMAVHSRPNFLIRSPRSIVGRLVGVAGLSQYDAMRALTIDAARISGVDDRLGSIEPGKDADIVIWDGDPLEAQTVPANVIISGVDQSLVARGDLLGQRYLDAYRAKGLIR